MDPSNLNAMLVAASELAMESRWREAVEVARQAVALAPSEYRAWWLLAQAYDKLGRSSDAVHAYAECYRHAPRQDDLRAIRSFAAKRAGIPFEEGDDAGDDSREEVVNFVVTIGGKRMLVQAHNDSGRTLEEVVEAAETLIQSPNPFDAWVHAEKHRELFSGLADTVLSALAQAQPEARARAGVERYRDALRRVRSGEGVLPFAEMAQIDEAEFLAFVTAVDDLQPVIQELAAATTDADRDAILGRHPELVADPRTLVFLRLLGGVQHDADAREMIQTVFTFIRRARSAAHRSAPSARVRQVAEQSTTAVERGNLAAIDAALAEWEAIATRGHDDDASSAALHRGALRLARYDRAGDAADLELACAILAEAMQAETDPESPLLPYHHGIALLRRFEHGGRMVDLEQGIAAMRHVLTLVVDGTRVEGAARSMLGAMLMRRAESTGSIADLDAAVAAHRLAVTAAARPADLALRLTNLGNAYVERFEAAGNVDDLDEAERSYQEARDLAPSSTAAVGALARLWRARYRLSEDVQWLDRAIIAYRSSSEASDSPLAVALVHNNLSAALRDRYLAHGDVSDLDAAIEASRRALAVAPAGYLQRPVWLENLANHLRVRAMRTGSAEDRRAAIAAYEEAIALAPEGSDVWRTAPMNLGALLTDVDETDRALELLEVGFARATAAAANVDIVEAARSLALVHARGRRWARAGEVLVAGMGALERLQRVQLSSRAKSLWLEKAGDLHLLAAEMFLRAGDVGEALAAIERGRGRLLAEVLSRDRAAFAALERTGDQRLVERYRTAAGQVRLLTAAAERDLRVRPALVAAVQSLEAIAEEARQATGDVAFSRPWTIEDIVDAARAAGAPLLYIVPLSELGVVIIVKGEPAEVRAIALPAVTTAQVDQVVERYVTAYRGSVESAEPAAWERWEWSLDETTQWCWEACMRDVVAALGDVREAVLIPVGRLGRLPLHLAAGGGSSALDAAIWRQSPNARSLSQLPPVDAESLLTVTFADEEEPLPAIGVEMAAVRRAFSTVRALDGEAATVAAVFDEIRHATALHFACHATAGGDDARAGGLVLADGSVSLQELFDVRLAGGALVVLSACETGVIGERLPDEALSLASGMLQSGASAVVSSLWSVPDASTAILMSRFYYLWREHRQAPAAALRDAQRWMRDSSNGAIATFLRVNLPHELIDDLAKALEREADGATFRHCVHWGAFTYSGR